MYILVPDLTTKVTYTEEQLVAMLQNRDQQVISVLYDMYSSTFYGVLSRMFQSQEVAEDLLQEVFVKIWKNASTYDASRGRLYTWMLNITRNTAIDHMRSKDFKSSEKIQRMDNAVYHINKQYSTDSKVDHIGLSKVLDTLKQEHRSIIDLIYFNGYTQSEVAEELSIPLGTVKTRVKMAMDHLRKVLK